jgi:hypothetical protein
MRNLIALVLMTTGIHGHSQEIYKFTEESDITDWYIVDDNVMGGRSKGGLEQSDEGHAIFQGNVSLENNGGFSSVRYRVNSVSCKEYATFRIHLKGDTKKYQFRVRSNLREYQSYVYEFETSGNWEVIYIPFDAMYPSWRGMKLDMPNFQGEVASEFSFLISNKRNENFRLEIDRIWME